MGKITAERAMRIARVKYGRRALLEDRGRRFGPSSPEKRAAGQQECQWLAEVKPTFPAIEDYPQDRTVGDYVAERAKYRVEYAAWKKKHDEAQGRAAYKRFAVGEDLGLFFHVYGQGDSWEEALKAAGFTDANIHPNLVVVE